MITLTAITLDDAAPLWPLIQDPALYTYTEDHRPPGLAAWQSRVARWVAGAPADSGETWLNAVIRDRASGAPLGLVQATREADGRLWVGYRIGSTHAGRGVATAALQVWLQQLLARWPGSTVWASVDLRHTASRRVLDKCGFVLDHSAPSTLHGAPSEDALYRFGPPGR
ncbi:GNAT family N-acetyltransferase [Ideonella alba]|uniref:GNAT family N-acetyltransferase n=1 Tax=Ideonella alba TaxID=2824118 RepID=A0A940YFW9_9BURK|nr:GNAT family N-acetyltransferase [Ideonella alba]MBQ0933428.1 GNAT family N-acetyltransferase [Ideonella alba]